MDLFDLLTDLADSFDLSLDFESLLDAEDWGFDLDETDCLPSDDRRKRIRKEIAAVIELACSELSEKAYRTFKVKLSALLPKILYGGPVGLNEALMELNSFITAEVYMCAYREDLDHDAENRLGYKHRR